MSNTKQQKNIFTVYWLHGEKSIIVGADFADAMNKAGYGNGALPAVDFYIEGICDQYIREGKEWVKSEPLIILSSDLEQYTSTDIVQLLKKHTVINVQYPSLNLIELSFSSGLYHLNNVSTYVRYMCVLFAEYYSGSYDGEDETGHYYMVSHSQYVDMDKLESAADLFLKRAKSEFPSVAYQHEDSVRLEEISDKYKYVMEV